MFSAVSVTAVHHYGKSRTCLGIMSYFALAHFEYYIFLALFEGYRLGGIKMETSGAIFASLFTLAVVAWYVWPEGIVAPAPVDDNAPLTESEEDKLFWCTLTIDGCSAALTSWNASSIKSLPCALGSILLYNCFIYGMFSAVSAAALHHYGKRRTWLGAMSCLALVHLEYSVFLICFEAHRLGGTKMKTIIAIYASLSILVAAAWHVLLKCIETSAPSRDNAPLTESEKGKMFWYGFIIAGFSAVLSSWNATWITSLSFGAPGATMVYNCLIYGLFSAVSAAALHRFGKRRTWLGVMSYLTLAHLEYFVFLTCFEGHRLLGIKMLTSGTIFASLGTLVAVAWSVFVSHEWWKKKTHAHHIGGHRD